jgi:hypothetical protein
MNISYKESNYGYIHIQCPFVTENKISKSSCLFDCKYFSHYPNTNYNLFTCKYVKVGKKSYKDYNKRRFRKVLGDSCDFYGNTYTITFKKER